MKSTKPHKVIVGMSGGVDSSVAALLLQREGYRVEGLFMKNWDEDDGTEYCTAKQDLADAQAVADTLGIDLHTATFAYEYWNNVFLHFLNEYHSGRTPNPDIMCNKEIKFRAFLDYAIALGADSIATGHYVRTGYSSGKATLLKGVDYSKDQSYFLYMVGNLELSKSIFPIGALSKRTVRSIAKDACLINHSKKDSTGICFIGERRFSDFLKQYVKSSPGNIMSTDGVFLGTHEGLMFYTIGQRKGLGIGGRADCDELAWYVTRKDVCQNILVCAQGNNHPDLYGSALRLKNCHWISGNCPTLPLNCMAKIRYRQQDQNCTLIQEDDGFEVRFSTPQRAITPGQSIVFYVEDQCLGGGIIEDAYS